MNVRTFIFILVGLAAIAGAWFVGKEFSGARNAAQPDADQTSKQVDQQPAAIHGQGRLQPQSGVIKIMAAPGERVDQLNIPEIGQPVKKGDVLAILHSRELRLLELEMAKAKLADAQSSLTVEKELGQFKQKSANFAIDEAESAKSTIEGKAKNVELLKNRLEIARQMLKRLESLKSNPLSQDLVNQTDIDQQSLMVQQAESQIQEALIELSNARESAVRATDAANNNLDSIKFTVDSAESQIPKSTLLRTIELAQFAYDSTSVKSPIDGTLLDVIVKQGDTVSNQPILIVGNLEQMICEGEINASQMQFVIEGATATLTSEALKQPLTGVVVEKGIMIGPPSMKDPNPYASVDRRTGKVTIQLDAASTTAAKGFVNLQVDVEIASSKSDAKNSDPVSTTEPGNNE